MFICYITPEYVIPPDRLDGGLANYTRKVAIALIERGHDVVVVCVSGRNLIWDDNGVKVIEVKQIKIRRFRHRVFERVNRYLFLLDRFFTNRRVRRVVWGIHKNKPIDLIHASSYKSPCTSLLRNSKIPIVCRISSNTSLYRSANGVKPSLASYLDDWFEIMQITRSDACIAPSEKMIKVWKQLSAVTPKLIRTPIDETKWRIDESLYFDHLQGKRYLLYFGTLNGIKGIDILAEALPIVFKKYKDIHFVLIGRDSGLASIPSLAKHIYDINQEYKNRIHIFPAKPKPVLFGVLLHAIGVVLPSRVDNYPNVCLEAQLFGKIVIGTRESSLDEMIIDGETGLLVENGDVSSLAENILHFLELPDAAVKQMETNILKNIEKIKQEDRIGSLIDFYNRVIDDFNK
jgi:glycosyltransferase involved in cell wall biosynthesis